MNLRTEQHTRPRLVGGTCADSIGVYDPTTRQMRLYRATVSWHYRAADLGTTRAHVHFTASIEQTPGCWMNVGNDASVHLRNALSVPYNRAVIAAGESVFRRRERLRQHLENYLPIPVQDYRGAVRG